MYKTKEQRAVEQFTRELDAMTVKPLLFVMIAKYRADQTLRLDQVWSGRDRTQADAEVQAQIARGNSGFIKSTVNGTTVHEDFHV